MVSAIDTTGGIRNIKILKFGDNYSSNFYLGAVPDGAYTSTGEAIQTSGDAELNTYVEDSIDQFSEQGVIQMTTYMSSIEGLYFDIDYISESSVSFATNQAYYAEDYDSALILCKVGPMSTHRGRYISQVGMPSWNSKIQDSNVYSDFSYQIKTKTDIQKYKTTIESQVHPVGFKMFGEKFVDQILQIQPIVTAQINTSETFVNGFLKQETYAIASVQANQMTVKHMLSSSITIMKISSTTAVLTAYNIVDVEHYPLDFGWYGV